MAENEYILEVKTFVSTSVPVTAKTKWLSRLLMT